MMMRLELRNWDDDARFKMRHGQVLGTFCPVVLLTGVAVVLLARLLRP